MVWQCSGCGARTFKRLFVNCVCGGRYEYAKPQTLAGHASVKCPICEKIVANYPAHRMMHTREKRRQNEIEENEKINKEAKKCIK